MNEARDSDAAVLVGIVSAFSVDHCDKKQRRHLNVATFYQNLYLPQKNQIG